MTDPRIEKLAEILVNYSVGVKPGDWVVIMAKVVSEPLILETAASVLRAGGNVTPILSSDTLTETMVRVSNPDQSQWVSPLEVLAVEKADAIISIEGTANTRNLSGIESGKLRLRRAARNDLNQTLMDRNARGGLRWVSSLFPCQAFAQEADMSPARLRGFRVLRLPRRPRESGDALEAAP